MGSRVADLRPISASPVNTNLFSMIAGGRVADILRLSSTYTINTKIINSTILIETVSVFFRPRFTSTIVTTNLNSTIVRGRLAGLNKSMSTYSINHRHFKNFIIINTIVVIMVGGRMAVITRPISYTSITTYSEITCSDYPVGPALLVCSMASGNELHWDKGLDCVRFQG